jgi:acyl-CoA synthetase (AMP-forming)/AMP-acid ligase II
VEKDGKEIGEIVCLGNICAKGYLKDAEATKLFAGGVLHTGDLAVWHPTGLHRFWTEPRTSLSVVSMQIKRCEVVIAESDDTGGENISSVALESMLATHPDILEGGGRRSRLALG